MKKVPMLRFPGFSGEWEEKRLGDFTVWASGGTPPKDDDAYWNGDIPWISASSMRGYEYHNSDLKITKEGLKKGSKLAKKGSLLILVRGSMLFNTIPVGIATRDVAFNQDVKSIEVNKGSTPTFILYWFLSSEHKLLNIVTGTGIGAGKLDLPELKLLEVNLPALSEQQKIADFLSAVDARLQALKKKKALLEQYKKGVMQQIFKQEIRFKGDDGRGFPDWEEKKLGEVIDIKSSKYNPENSSNSIKCIELEHLSSEEGRLLGYVDGQKLGSIKNAFNKGDVLFGKLRPYLKKYLIAPFDGVCSSEIWVFKGRGVIHGFLYYLIQTNKFIDLANMSTGSKMPRADWNVVSMGLFDIPSLPEQQKIADFLTSLDEKISRCSAQVVGMEWWKKGLLQGLFV